VRSVRKTDADPRVRRRAQALLLVEEGHSQARAARVLHTSAYRVHVWQDRFASAGRAGLVDRPRGGRPHALSDADRAVLEAALERGPQAYDLPMTVGSIRDLQALLGRERAVHAMICPTAKIGRQWRRPTTCWTGSQKN
jgi:transposase